MLIQWYTYVNSFHQLSFFEFAVYFEWDEKLRTYEIGNESKLQVEITFKQKISVTLGNWMTEIIMLIHWYTSINSFHQLSYFEFAVCTINKMKFENKSVFGKLK